MKSNDDLHDIDDDGDDESNDNVTLSHPVEHPVSTFELIFFLQKVVRVPFHDIFYNFPSTLYLLILRHFKWSLSQHRGGNQK